MIGGAGSEDGEYYDYDANHVSDSILRHTVSDELSKGRLETLSSCITAMSNISVQYNFQAISIALIVMSQEECTSSPDDCKNGDQASWVQSTATATVFAGCIAGQLTVLCLVPNVPNDNVTLCLLFLYHIFLTVWKQPLDGICW